MNTVTHFRSQCPQCGFAVKAPATALNKRGCCPKCHTVFRVLPTFRDAVKLFLEPSMVNKPVVPPPVVKVACSHPLPAV